MPGDTYWANVSLLLHCNSVAFPDTSLSAHTVTNYNGCVCNGSIYLFGGGSLQAPFGAAAIGINSGADLDFSTGDWTIEGACYLPSGGAGFTHTLLNKRDGSNKYPYKVLIDSSNAFTIQGLDSSGSTVYTLSGGTIATDTWIRFAAVRHGNVFTLYMDGVSTDTTTSAAALAANSDDLFIGGGGPTYTGNFHGEMDEVRFTKGVARYTSNYTPAAAEFPEGFPGPTITVQPSNQSVPAGSEATFSVTATSSGGALHYQWYANASLVPGATSSSYLTPPTSAGDNGTLYTVVVTDDNGNVTSDPATLTVTGGVFISYLTQFSDSLIFPTTFGKKLGMTEFVYYPMRPTEEGVDLAPAVDNLIINRYKQQPTDTRKRGVDFTLFCEDGETITDIATPTVSPATGSPLVVSSLLIDPDGQKFSYDVTGGEDGVEYQVGFAVTFNTQQLVTEQVIFQIAVNVEDQNV